MHTVHPGRQQVNAILRFYTSFIDTPTGAFEVRSIIPRVQRTRDNMVAIFKYRQHRRDFF